MSNLAGKQIENTYRSILNIGTEAAPNGTLAATLSTVTDGANNQSSLRIGASGAGIGVQGPLFVTSFVTVSGDATILGTVDIGNITTNNVTSTTSNVDTTLTIGLTGSVVEIGDNYIFSTNTSLDINSEAGDVHIGRYNGSTDCSLILGNSLSPNTYDLNIQNGSIVFPDGSTQVTAPTKLVWLDTPVDLTVNASTVLSTLPDWTTSVIVEAVFNTSGGTTKSVYLKKTVASAIQYVLIGNVTDVSEAVGAQGTYPVEVGSPPSIYAAVVGSPTVLRVIAYS